MAFMKIAGGSMSGYSARIGGIASGGDDGTRERGAEAGVRRRAAAGDGWGAARAAEFARERALERATESVEPTETAGDAIGPAEELHGRGFEWIGER